MRPVRFTKNRKQSSTAGTVPVFFVEHENKCYRSIPIIKSFF